MSVQAIQPVSFSRYTPSNRTIIPGEPKAQKSFATEWADTTLLRGARDFAGQALDNRFKMPDVFKPAFASIAAKAQPFTANAQPYRQVFGINTDYIQAKPAEWKELIATREGRTTIASVTAANFNGFKAPNTTVKGFAKHTLIGANLTTITNPLAEGKVFTASSKALGAWWGIVPVIKATIHTYEQTDSITQASGVFLRESIKALAAWEVGSIGYLLGLALVPVAGLQIISALVFMGLASAATKKALG